MKLLLLATAMGVMASLPAEAVLTNHGVTYKLETQATADPLTNLFALVITGENTLNDTEAGRTGINAFALNNPTGVNAVSGHILLPPSGFTFVSGGLNSSGCDGSGNFYCFDNTAIPPTPTALLSGPLTLVFSVTLGAGGSWTDYNPSFKIDWVGTNQNYDLVSQVIGISPGGCPDCGVTPVVVDTPEPLSLAVLGVGLLGLGTVRYRSRGTSV